MQSTFSQYNFMNHFNVILPSTPISIKRSHYSGLESKILDTLLVSPVFDTLPTQQILVYFRVAITS
jgi:hypothetical protein